MNRKSRRVAELTSEAVDFLAKDEPRHAEAAYRRALAEGVRLLGLHDSLTRNALSLYSSFLRESQRPEEATQYEALYWLTARPESFRLAVLFGSVSPEVQEFLHTHSDWLERYGEHLLVESRKHKRNWDWGKFIAEASRSYFRSLRQYVVE